MSPRAPCITRPNHSHRHLARAPPIRLVDTCATLQLWTQIIGKIRLALVRTSPLLERHLYPPCAASPPCPCRTAPHAPNRLRLSLAPTPHRHKRRRPRTLPLQPMSVADFYHQVTASLDSLGAPSASGPCPVKSPTHPFAEDKPPLLRSEYAQRFAHIVLQTTRVFSQFRAAFAARSVPSTFFGSARSRLHRFSGRTAPSTQHARPPDRVTRDAYSHEVSSAGFWPGDPALNLLLQLRLPRATRLRGLFDRASLSRVQQGLRRIRLPTSRCANPSTPTAHCWSSYRPLTRLSNNAHWDRVALEVS